MKLIKLHVGLFRYVKMELKKKRTPKQLVKFYKELVVAYIKEIIKLYTELFLILDADYQKQKKEYKKMSEIKRDLYRALKMLKYIDTKLTKIGKDRAFRRNFWREFFKDGAVRKEVFDDLMKEIGG